MNNGKLRGAYSSWVNARTLEGDKLKNIYFFPIKLWIAIGWNESLLYHVQPKYYIKFNGKWTRFQPLRIPFDILSCGPTKRLVIGHYRDTRVSPCRCWLHCVEKWLARDTLRWFLILLVRCPIKNSPILSQMLVKRAQRLLSPWGTLLNIDLSWCWHIIIVSVIAKTIKFFLKF